MASDPRPSDPAKEKYSSDVSQSRRSRTTESEILKPRDYCPIDNQNHSDT